MALILGIDAAWTKTGSSGVALLKSVGSRRELLAVAPSYAGFVGLANGVEVDWVRPLAGEPVVADLLRAATTLGESSIDVVAIDIPLAHTAVTGRRHADQEVSKCFGAAGASVHSPSAERPGEIGKRVMEAFVAAGFRLITQQQQSPAPRSLIEVFPLAALVRLMELKVRPAYKVARMRRYWRELSRAERIDRLLQSWRGILEALGTQLSNLSIPVPERSLIRSAASLKPYEDAIDAVISAWVGARFLEGRAQRFGDAEAAIWIPTVSSFLSGNAIDAID